MLKSKTIKIYLTSLFLLFFFFGNLQIALAEKKENINKIDLELQTKIPGSDQGNVITFDGTTRALGDYISSIYTYAISIVGILATIMLMFGGFVWLTAGGSGDKVGQAREIIFGSLTGLVLALSSYTILNLINPGLVNFKINQIDTSKKSPGIVFCDDEGKCPAGSGLDCVNGRCVGKADQSIGCCLYNLTTTGVPTECITGVTKKGCEQLSGGGDRHKYSEGINLKCEKKETEVGLFFKSTRTQAFCTN